MKQSRNSINSVNGAVDGLKRAGAINYPLTEEIKRAPIRKVWRGAIRNRNKITGSWTLVKNNEFSFDLITE